MKKPEYAISIYEGLDEYSFGQSLNYIEMANRLGIKTVFTSAHIPESSNIENELTVIAEVLSRYKMKLIIDVSKPIMEKFLIPNVTYSLRLDWGFSDEDIIKMSNEMFCNIELNAATISIEYLKKLINQGLNVKRTRLSYNFYPKPYTGLDIFEMKEKNKQLHELGFVTMAFIASQKFKRPPLYKGVPTIEDHRNKSPLIATEELLLAGIDEIGMGDAYATKEELTLMESCTLEDIKIPIIVDERLDNEVLKLLKSPQHSRPDQSPYMVRSSLRANKKIKAKNTIDIKKYDVTVDNEKNLRYMGEIGIWLKDVKAEEGVNVVGHLDPDAYNLIRLLKPGSPFSFIVKGRDYE